MAIRIVPHGDEHRDAVEAFNQRLFRSGQKLGFYVEPRPDWLADPGAPVWREYHLAVDEERAVRGAFALKPQEWLVKGERKIVSDWQGPFSEGAVNPRYGAIALRLMRDMVKKQPLLYSYGHGGSDEPIVRLVEEMGWTVHAFPICLRVVRPRAFLRRNALLRRDPRKRLLLDLAAFSGVGSVALRALHLGLRAWRPRLFPAVESAVEPRFGAWADQLWDAARGRYRALAVRDAAMMNRLVPEAGWPPVTRLRVSRGGRTIGWAVVLERRMADDPRFGTLRVGNVTDCFAAPEEAGAVVAAATRFLSRAGAELIYANVSHPAWTDGFADNGYLVLPKRRLFAVSPPLRAALAPFEETLAGLHLTNLDGHGPQDYR